MNTPIVFHINGIRRAGYETWPDVPRVDEGVTLHGTNYKVARINWVSDSGNVFAHVYLKPAHTYW